MASRRKRNGELSVAQLRVEIFYDHEVDLWGYSVPVLSIIGTGRRTREDAESFVVDAIEVTLEDADEEPTEGAEVITYDVQSPKPAST